MNLPAKEFPLEIADLKLETADGPASGDLDDATRIIVAHLVTQETERLTGEIASLKDQLEVAKVALEASKTEFAGFKANLETEAEIAKVTKTRVAEVAKAQPSLEATDERMARWGTMSETEFAAYLADIAAVAPAAPGAGTGRGFTGQGESAATVVGRTAPQPDPAGAGGPDTRTAQRTVLGLGSDAKRRR